jgi:hypothetical protein
LTGHAGHVPAQPEPGSGREYARWRARQIAYGRWQPWADAGPVREHVRLLRESGASYRAIADAAGVSVMMVHRLQCGEPACGRPAPPRVRALHARRLLAVTIQTLRDDAARRDAGGARWRLRALTAMGHPATILARHLDVPPRVAWDLIRGSTATISHDLYLASCGVYERMWDLRPPERTCAERRAAAAARGRAARNGWPPPMGLDDELIDDPAYRPRAQWRPAVGTGLAPAPVPRSRDGAQRGHATRQPTRYPARGAEEVS